MHESLIKTILFTTITTTLTYTPTPILQTLLLLIDVTVYWTRAAIHRLCSTDQTTTLTTRLATATSATEYARTAFELDRVSGNALWKDNLVSRRYDYALIRDRVRLVREVRESGDLQRLLSLLRAGVLRNFGGISNAALYEKTFTGTKVLIEEYNYEMCACVRYVDACFGISVQDKLDLFHDARTTLGTTALCLHGGALFGMAHVGVVDALVECELLPTVVVGSGVGSAVAAVACTGEWGNPLREKSDETELFSGDKVELLRKGLTPEMHSFLNIALTRVDSLTFKDAFTLTHRALNILVYPDSERVPRLLNYLTTPYVTIRNAIICSMGTGILREDCQLEGYEKCIFYPPYEVSENAPFERVTELFNVNHFVVSVSRPYLKPLVLPRCRRLTKLIALELKHWLRVFNYFGLLSSTAKWILLDEKLSLEESSNVTIVPQGNKWIFWEIVDLLRSNGNAKYWIECGKRSVYERRSLLETRMRMEFILNEYFEKYRNKP